MKRVFLLTRQTEQNQRDQTTRFAHIEAEFISLPLIAFQNTFVWHQEQLNALAEFKWLFFTSQQGVRAFFTTLLQAVPKSELSALLADKSFAVVGQKSRQMLQKYGYQADFQPQQATKKTLLAEWQHQFPTVQTRRLWLVGNHAVLPETPTDCYWPLYRNYCPPHQLRALTTLLHQTRLTDYFVSSPSIWRRFYQIYQTIPQCPLHYYCLGPTTAAAIHQDLGATIQLTIIK